MIANHDKLDLRLRGGRYDIVFRGTICLDLQRLISIYYEVKDSLPQTVSDIFENWIVNNTINIEKCTEQWVDSNTIPPELDSSLIDLAQSLGVIYELLTDNPEFQNLIIPEEEIDIEEKSESAEDFLLNDRKLTNAIKGFNSKLKNLILSPESATQEDKNDLLQKMFLHWHNSKDPADISNLASLLTIALIYMPEKYEEIMSYLISGAEQEYFIHKNIIFFISKAIRIMPEADNARVIEILINRVTDFSNEVRQLVTRVLGEIVIIYPEKIRPILEKVAAEDEDQSNVARFARMGLEKLGERSDLIEDLGMSTDSYDRANVCIDDSLDPKITLDELREKLLKSEQVDRVLDTLEGRFLWNDNIQERTKIINVLNEYLTNVEDLYIWGIRHAYSAIFVSLDNKELAQSAYEAFKMVMFKDAKIEQQRLIIELLSYNFDCFVHFIEDSLVIFNSLFYDKLCYSNVIAFKDYLKMIFREWFTTPGWQSEKFLSLLSLKFADPKITIAITPVVVLFLQEVIADHNFVDKSLKKAALQAMNKLAQESNSYSVQYAVLNVLDLFISISINQELVSYAQLIKGRIRLFEIINSDGDFISESDITRTQDEEIIKIIHLYKKNRFDECIKLIEVYDQKYDSYNEFIELIKAKSLYNQNRLDAAKESLINSQYELSFITDISNALAEIYYLKGQRRLAEEQIERIKEIFPNYREMSTVKVSMLSEKAMSDSNFVFHPLKNQINSLCRLVNDLLEAINEDEISKLKDDIDSKCKQVFGDSLFFSKKRDYNFEWQFWEELEYINEKYRYLKQFIEYLARSELDHYYYRQLQLFQAQDIYRDNIMEQIKESKIANIYNKIYPESISTEDLLQLIEGCGIEVLPVFSFLRKYSTQESIIGSFSLGISTDLASTYDVLVRLFGLQPWAMTYGEFNIYDMDDEIHTPAVLEAMLEDSQNRKIIFFIPSSIGDDRESAGVTYHEVKWIFEQIKGTKFKLSNIVFVMDSYNYLPYWLLERSGESEVDPKLSRNNLINFIENEILGESSLTKQFRNVQNKVNAFNSELYLYQKEVLYDWIKIVNYTKKPDMKDKKLQIYALDQVRKALIKYFITLDEQSFHKDCETIVNGVEEGKRDQIKYWLDLLISSDDFKDVKKQILEIKAEIEFSEQSIFQHFMEQTSKLEFVEPKDAQQTFINDIKEIAGKQALDNDLGFNQYIANALSSNYLSLAAKKLIEIMGNLSNSLRSLIDNSELLQIDVDEQATLFWTQLEYLLEFTSSGQRFTGISFRSPYFDPDDYGGSGRGGSSGGVVDIPNQAESGEPMVVLLPAGQLPNETVSNS